MTTRTKKRSSDAEDEKKAEIFGIERERGRRKGLRAL